MPSLAELRAFIVAEELHFTRAARRLGIAPPTLSQSIRRLEASLDAVLLQRTPRSVRMTEAGAELLPRARDILARMDEVQAALHVADEAGTLTVGIASNGFAEVTAPIMQAFRRSHPKVGIVLRDVTNEPPEACDPPPCRTVALTELRGETMRFRALSADMAGEFTPWERETLEVFPILRHEVAATALALRADYVSAHLRFDADELVVFTYDRGRMTVTCRGFEAGLSRLPEW